MKRKISLRIELVVIMLGSLIISFTMAICIRNWGMQFYTDHKSQRIQDRYTECIQNLQDRLLYCDVNNTDEVNRILREDYGYSVGYAFYLVNKQGEVLGSSMPGVVSIETSQIVNGQIQYQVSDKDKNLFRITGCESIKSGYYLYFTYLYYGKNDTNVVIGAVVGAVVFFFLLIWRRIAYISQIRKSVNKMIQGKLSERIPYRYKNELQGLAEDINKMAESLELEEQKKK